MVRTKTIAKIAGILPLLGGIFVASPVIAKPWDVDRYTECLQREGQGSLDLIESIHSDACRKGRAVIDDSDYPVGYFDISASVAASRDKKNLGDWAVFAKFRVATTDSRFYGPAAALNQQPREIPHFSATSTLIGGQLYELPISSQKEAIPDCESFSRGRLGMSKCELVTGVVVHLSSDVIEKIIEDARSQPLGNQMFKLFTPDFKGITIKIPYAEIIAVATSAR